MKVEESVVIDRPPQDVFAYLAIRSDDAVCMASVIESRGWTPTPGILRRSASDDAAG